MAETSREQLYEALRQADAAGDTAAAQKLADYIRTLPPEEPGYQVPRQQGEIEKAARAVGSKVLETGQAAGKWARDAFFGPSDLPELPEFGAPAPTGMGTAKAGFGLMMTNNPQAQADILRKQYPGIKIQPVRSEESGDEYMIADWTDERGQRHQGYINAPGFSGRDATNIAGQAVAYMPAARFGQGASILTGSARRAVPGLMTRMARTGAATAATRIGLDKAVEPLGSEQGVNFGEAAVTGAAGAAAEVAAPLVSGAYRAIRGNPLTRGDGLSRAGQRVARDAGLDPTLPPTAQQEFARVAETGDIGGAARSARLKEFGIPASRGQLTQDYEQLNLEDRMRRSLLGPEAGEVMTGFDKRQAGAIADAADQVQGRLQPRQSADLFEAQSRFQGGMEAAERAASQRVDDAYTGMRARGTAAVPVPARNDLATRFAQALDAQDAFADPNLTPAALFAMKQIDKRIGGAGGAVTLKDFEKARRVVNGAANASKNPADRRGVLILKRELDNWLDETVDNGLLAGDPEVVKLLKDARAARAEYGRLFEARGPGDTAGKIVNKIVEKAETPEQAMNYILGQGQLAGRVEAVGAARKLKEILGADSDAWNAVREAAWTRLARDAKTGKPMSPEKFRGAWNDFSLRNRSLRDELFSPEEVAMMNRYRQALLDTNRPPTNASQTAFGLESMVRYMLRRAGTAQTFQGNTGQGAILHSLARSPFNPFGLADWAKRMQAVRATRPLPGGGRPLVAPVAIGTPAIDQAQR